MDHFGAVMKAWLLYALIVWGVYIALTNLLPAPWYAKTLLWVGLVASFGQKPLSSEG